MGGVRTKSPRSHQTQCELPGHEVTVTTEQLGPWAWRRSQNASRNLGRVNED